MVSPSRDWSFRTFPNHRPDLCVHRKESGRTDPPFEYLNPRSAEFGLIGLCLAHSSDFFPSKPSKSEDKRRLMRILAIYATGLPACDARIEWLANGFGITPSKLGWVGLIAICRLAYASGYLPVLPS